MTDAVKPSVTQLLLPDDQYVDHEFDKVQVYIHHTASDGNPFEVQKYWISNKEAVSTAYLIGGRPNGSTKWKDGEIFECFDETKGGWHLGLKAEDLARGGPKHKSTSYLNMGSIGIELCNWGGLTKNKKGKYVSYDGTVVPNDQVQEYDIAWRGYKYYQQYSTAQIESLRLLLTYLCEKYNIPKTYNFKMWDIAPEALQGVKGIWTHVSVRPANEKQDCHPQPELCDMLVKLGQNEMKLTDIAKKALQEAESKAAEQAHHLGLEPAAYGNWKDNTGKVVAKSVKGGEALIKTASDEEPEGTEPEESDELPEPTASDLEEPEDLIASESPEMTPDDEYVPAPSAVVPDEAPGQSLGGGDVSRALTILAKKFHDSQGNPERQAAIKAQIDKVKAAEAAETQHMVDALAKVQARKDAQAKATRDALSKNPKYAALLNNPNKDL